MDEMTITVKTTARDILAGKLSKTLQAVEAAYQEANGDVQVGQSWSANAVRSRVERIRINLFAEMEALANDITLIPVTTPPTQTNQWTGNP